ncbi:MAG: D-galactosaminyltransferase, partial [Mycobacterium sp.]|nr:D-galactosaminyltransferase [Mycobacterium sp.]
MLALGALPALLLLIVPGALIGIAARLPWPVAIAVAPALTYGLVGLAIVPFGAIGWPWNGWTALFALAVVLAVAIGLRVVLSRYRDRDAESLAVSTLPAVTVAAGIACGAALIGAAVVIGLVHWQSIPSTWDAVWHANEVRYILDTGQASPTRMGELRNVETHAPLYYPSAFHALTAVLSQLTGTSATTAYTLSSVVSAVWLVPVSAAALTWQFLRSRTSEWRTAGCAAAAAAMSASFTALPYVEFDTASMPNLVAYGIAAPTMVLVVSVLRHRDRVPVAVLALVGVFSVHTTGGVVVALFTGAWWACEALWHPIRSRLADVATLLMVGLPAALLLLPQFLGVLKLTDIIAGHAFTAGVGRKRALFNAVVGHTRHLNDFPVQWAAIALAGVGFLILLVRRIWWPLAVWLILVAAAVHSAAPYGTFVGRLVSKFSDLFYSDPRRLFAVITLLLAPMAGVALFTVAAAVVAASRRVIGRRVSVPPPVWAGVTAAIVLAVSVGYGLVYFPRHQYLMGQKYDSVMIDHKDLEAMAYLATLPGARDTLIGDANTDGTAWMYAVAGLRPLWTHYDYPVQQGPGYNRYIFWAYADDADSDPRVAEAVRALGIRYVMTSTPVVREFVMP